MNAFLCYCCNACGMMREAQNIAYFNIINPDSAKANGVVHYCIDQEDCRRVAVQLVKKMEEIFTVQYVAKRIGVPSA